MIDNSVDRMASRKLTKTFRYGLVLFIETQELGIVKGHAIHGRHSVGMFAETEWEGTLFFTRILELAGKDLRLLSSSISILRLISRKSMICCICNHFP